MSRVIVNGIRKRLRASVAVLRSGHAGHDPLWELWSLCGPLMKLVARLHNTCIHSVASRSWCQITPLTQSCIRTSGIPPPQIQIWSRHGPPQTAAARNAPDPPSEQASS